VENSSNRALCRCVNDLNYTAGMKIYANIGGVYVGEFEVYAVNAAYIILNTTFTYNATGFINSNDSRQNYYNIVKITPLEPVTQNELEAKYLNIRPDSTGLLNVNVKPIIISLIEFENNYTYNTENLYNEKLSGLYRIDVSENYTGFTGAFNNLITERWGYIAGANQIGNENNSSVVDYWIGSIINPGKFLTKFNEPMYFEGFPFELCYALKEIRTFSQLYRKESERDINDNEITSTISALNDDALGLMYHMRLLPNYNINTRKVYVWIQEYTDAGVYIERDYIESEYIE
jgi:hypothetical protein